ncbi:MAG TPA: recombinase XerD, partial [Archaeoglobaceae archaeon]|nr:recombinase XerD [Archaeoglobaceae archaeon]
MKGTRPLTAEEILKVSEQFSGTYEIRNRALFMLGVSVGGRISELLALKIGDVWQNGRPVTDLIFAKSVVKGKENSRVIPTNQDCREAITELIDWHKKYFGDLQPERPLFVSRKHGKALTRTQGHRIICEAFSKAGLNGKLATHSLRKTFAQRLYDSTSDIALCQELLGHKNISTTRQYLSVSYEKCKKAVESIEIDNNRRHILLHSTSDNDLIVELQTRGYDISSV